MKDETCIALVKGFAWLKPKMYTFIIEDNYESKKITVIKLLSYKILRSQKCLVQ